MSTKIISYRPSDEVKEWIEKHTGKGSTLTMTGLIEIAMKFLMEWPEEEFVEIVGNSISADRLRAWVKSYVDMMNHMKD